MRRRSSRGVNGFCSSAIGSVQSGHVERLLGVARHDDHRQARPARGQQRSRARCRSCPASSRRSAADRSGRRARRPCVSASSAEPRAAADSRRAAAPTRPGCAPPARPRRSAASRGRAARSARTGAWPRRRPRAGAAAGGKNSVNVVPRPTSLSTKMKPPICFSVPYTIDSPRPVPLPTSLVVKNGSKMRACVSRVMPCAGVGDAQDDVPARPASAVRARERLVDRLRRGGRARQPAAVRHRVARVDARG